MMNLYPKSPPDQSQDSAMKSLLKNRTDLAETRLSVTATQIVDRLRIRASHLEQLMTEELGVGSRLSQLRDSVPDGRVDILGLESLLEQRGSKIKDAQRREDTECWRDLTNVMRDFLNAWEGFSKNEAKNRFLEALPSAQMTDNPDTMNPTTEPQPQVLHYKDDYSNPNRNYPDNQR